MAARLETAAARFKGRAVKALIALAALALAAGGWFWHQTGRYIEAADAQVVGAPLPIRAKMSGKVAAVLVKPGDAVTLGQVLVRMDAEAARAQKAKLEVEVAAAKARYEAVRRKQPAAPPRPPPDDAAVTAARAAADRAAKRRDQMRRLLAMGAVSAREAAAAQTAYEAAAAALDAARQALFAQASPDDRELELARSAAVIRQGEAMLTALNVAAAATVAVAPSDGVVAALLVRDGDTAADGQTLLTITDPARIWIEARVAAARAGPVKIGQYAEYTVAGQPGVFTGRVEAIGAADGDGRAPIKISPADGRTPPAGAAARVKIFL